LTTIEASGPAPALATADVGVAMGAAGTDVALETADVALMADGLAKLPAAVRLARRALANIRQAVVRRCWWSRPWPAGCR
jgi:Cd2+/Zn2+-exporting ATPase